MPSSFLVSSRLPVIARSTEVAALSSPCSKAISLKHLEPRALSHEAAKQALRLSVRWSASRSTSVGCAAAAIAATNCGAHVRRRWRKSGSFHEVEAARQDPNWYAMHQAKLDQMALGVLADRALWSWLPHPGLDPKNCRATTRVIGLRLHSRLPSAVS